MMKKAIYSAIVAMLWQLQLFSQTTSPNIVASSGGFYSNATAQLSFTTGELCAIQTISGGTNILTQGFQQNEQNGMGIDDNHEQLDISCWPNPSHGHLHISFSPVTDGQLTISVNDVLGQPIDFYFSRELGAGTYQEELFLGPLSAGVYYLQMNFQSNTGITTKKNQKINIINNQ